MKDKGPDRVSIRDKDKEIYDELQKKDKSSPLLNKRNRVLYMLALITGFSEGEPIKLDKKKGYILLENLSDEDKVIIKAIAVSEEKDLSVLTDREKVYTIADEYAAAGIRLLKKKILGREYGSYIKELESELIKQIRRIEGALSKIR